MSGKYFSAPQKSPSVTSLPLVRFFAGHSWQDGRENSPLPNPFPKGVEYSGAEKAVPAAVSTASVEQFHVPRRASKTFLRKSTFVTGTPMPARSRNPAKNARHTLGDGTLWQAMSTASKFG